MDTKFDFAELGDRVCYVKSVAVAELPAEVQKAVGAHDQVFAVHDSDGQQLALVADRGLAFTLARQNDMDPVTVH